MKIGLTGGIGTGKSFAMSFFEKKGAILFNSDLEAKKIVQNDLAVQKAIQNVFGKKAFDEFGHYNTKYITMIVFTNNYLLNRLNAIIHPKVHEAFHLFCEQHKNKLIIYESALIFENKVSNLFDKTILITAPIPLRIERLGKRDGLQPSAILKKMESQWPDSKKIPLADYVIDNQDKIEFEKALEQVWNAIKL
jgi:dephospho-CoA kinase